LLTYTKNLAIKRLLHHLWIESGGFKPTTS